MSKRYTMLDLYAVEDKLCSQCMDAIYKAAATSLFASKLYTSNKVVKLDVIRQEFVFVVLMQYTASGTMRDLQSVSLKVNPHTIEIDMSCISLRMIRLKKFLKGVAKDIQHELDKAKRVHAEMLRELLLNQEENRQ